MQKEHVAAGLLLAALIICAGGTVAVFTRGSNAQGVVGSDYAVFRARQDAADRVLTRTSGVVRAVTARYRDAAVRLLVADFNAAVARAGDAYEAELRRQLQAKIEKLDAGLSDEYARTFEAMRSDLSALVDAATVLDALPAGQDERAAEAAGGIVQR